MERNVFHHLPAEATIKRSAKQMHPDLQEERNSHEALGTKGGAFSKPLRSGTSKLNNELIFACPDTRLSIP
jgi:hypothetical protein